MAEVFLSYAHADATVARKLAACLKRLDLDVWLDSDIEPGEKWRDAVERQAKYARLVLVFWTPHAKHSDFVTWEAAQANREDRILQAFTGEASASIPPPFEAYQAIDFNGWDGDTSAACYLDLVARIGDKLDRGDLTDFALMRRIRDSQKGHLLAERRLRTFTPGEMMGLRDKVRDDVRVFDPDVMFAFDSRGGLWAEMFFENLTFRVPVIVGFRLKRGGPKKSNLVFEDCDLIQTERWDLYLPLAVRRLPPRAKVLFVDDYSYTGETCFVFTNFMIETLGRSPESIRTLTLITSPEAGKRGQRPDIVGIEETAPINLFYMHQR